MKKRMCAALCLLLLLITLIPVTTVAVSPYFLGINDKFIDLTLETEPIVVNGETYIPCTLFDRRVLGSELDVFYAWDTRAESVTIYDKSSSSLQFDIQAGNAYSNDKQKTYDYKAIMRNGMAYVPAYSTCTFFGLTPSILTIEDSKYQLLRIKNGNEVLNDQVYVRSVIDLVEDRVGKYNQGSTSSGQGVKKPTNEPTEKPNQVEEEAPGQSTAVYFAFRMDQGTNLDSMISALGGQYQIQAVFFFPVDRLKDSADLLRELVGQGQRIGLIPNGSTQKTQLESLQEGNRLLKHLVRQKAVFVLAEDSTEETKTAMQSAGFLPWSSNIKVSGQGISDSTIYQTVLGRVAAKKKGKARLLLRDTLKGGTLSSVLRQLQQDGYDLRSMRETDC